MLQVRGSSFIAGVDAGQDGFFGTSDDKKADGTMDTREFAGRSSTIASIVINGQALGSPTAGDSFGIVAERIVKAKIAARTFAFKPPGSPRTATPSPPPRPAPARLPTTPPSTSICARSASR